MLALFLLLLLQLLRQSLALALTVPAPASFALQLPPSIGQVDLHILQRTGHLPQSCCCLHYLMALHPLALVPLDLVAADGGPALMGVLGWSGPESGWQCQ